MDINGDKPFPSVTHCVFNWSSALIVSAENICDASAFWIQKSPSNTMGEKVVIIKISSQRLSNAVAWQ